MGSSATSSLASIGIKIKEVEPLNVGLSFPSLLPESAPAKFNVTEQTGSNTWENLLKIIETRKCQEKKPETFEMRRLTEHLVLGMMRTI